MNFKDGKHTGKFEERNKVIGKDDTIIISKIKK